MIGKIFGKKEPELVLSDSSDEEPRRPRFRRTRSAASESVYADYLSDDWGDAPTIHVDREGREIHSRSPSDDLEDWQRGGGVFGGVAARMRSMSFSKPNWNRAPPPAAEDQYRFGWADRVERAGGRDERQEKRDEARSRRPAATPVPNPAPGPIDVRRDEDPPGLGAKPPPGVPLRPPTEGATAQASTTVLTHPGLSRRATLASNRPTERTKIVNPDRSTTSSPTVIPHKDIGSGKPGHRRHLSRVEKIAAVFQHVASLPFLADTPVHTYYPPKEKQVVPPAEPFRTYDPTIPKRYRPPPPMPPCWYQPKPPKQKKAKKAKGEKGKMAIADELDDSMLYADEFEYPDFQEGYTGYTPTLQSDMTTEDTDTLYDQPRMIQDASFAQHSMRPAFFPGPIKSTGLTTQQQPGIEPVDPHVYPEDPRIYPHDPRVYPHDPRVYPYDPDSYTEGSTLYSEDSRYYEDDPHYYPDDCPAYPDPHMFPPGSHPDGFPAVPYPGMYYQGPPPNDHPVGPLPTAQTPGPRRLQIAAEPWESSSSSSSSRGPIPSPLTTAGARTVHARTPVVIPLDMPESVSGVMAAGPPLVIPTPTGAHKGMPERTPKGHAGPLPGGYSPAQPFAKHYEAYTPPKKSKGPSPRVAQGHMPKSRVRSPEEFYYVPPQGQKLSPLGGKGSSKGHGPSPHLPFGASPQGPYGPSPQFPYGPPPFPYGPSPQYAYGPSPQAPYGPSPQAPYGPSPQTGYGPSPQAAFSQAPQYVWTWGAPPYGEIPPPPPIPGESPPPIPSPIATSTARSRSSRR